MIKRLKLVAVILAVTLACNFLQPTPTPPSLPTVPPTVTVPAVATVNPTPLAGNSFLGLPWGDEAFYAPGVVSGQRENALGIRGATEYHIALTIESDLVNMHGREEILYTNRENVALGEVRLHLYPNIIGGKLAVSNLTVDSQPAQPALELNEQPADCSAREIDPARRTGHVGHGFCAFGAHRCRNKLRRSGLHRRSRHAGARLPHDRRVR